MSRETVETRKSVAGTIGGDGTMSSPKAPASTLRAREPRTGPGPARREWGLDARLGLNVPEDWWPSPPMLKSLEAAGFAWAQLHAPRASVLVAPKMCIAHAEATRAALETTGLRIVVHGPNQLCVGSHRADRVFEGLLAWAAEIGAEQVVYHARNFPDNPQTQQRALFETRSLAFLAARAERLGIAIAIENLAPVFPGPEPASASPLTLRALAHRIGSQRIGLCLDLGHAHIVAGLRHTKIEELLEPVLDQVSVFHLHDNLGARWDGRRPAGVDPLRLDLHLPPGRGTLPWGRVARMLADHEAPLLLEVHPPYRPRASELSHAMAELLG